MTRYDGQDDDALDALLRDALRNEADRTPVAPGSLEAVLHRAAQPGAGHPGLRRVLLAGAGLAVAAGVVAAVVLPGNGDDGARTTTVAGPTTPPATAPAPSTAPTTAVPTPSAPASRSSAVVVPSPRTAAETTPAAPAATVALPVYYVGDDGGSPRLYREFHDLVPTAAGVDAQVVAAVEAALAGDALDPDYASPWAPGTRVLDWSREGEVAVLDLSAAASSGDPARADVAVQQLVHTVTAVVSDPTLTVAVRVEGQAVDRLWNAVDTSAPVAREDAADVLAGVWLLSPAQGAHVGSPLTVDVWGSGYEGNVVVTAVDASGSTAGQLVLTTSTGTPSEASGQLALPPGGYRLEAATESGEDLVLVVHDTKDVTVG